MIGTVLCLSLLICADGMSVHSLYPYGTSVGDTTLQTDQVSVSLNRDVNFNGKKFRTVHINKDGMVTFDENEKYEDFNFTSRSRDPDTDPPFVAPLFYNGQSISSQNLGKIYYRTLMDGALANFSSMFAPYLIDATVETEQFQPKVALIVTWENVTDKAQVESVPCAGTTGNPCLSATFQLILAASEDETFLIISYLKVDIPVQQYYQAGINSGHGVGWTPVCPGCSISDLPTRKRSGGAGQYIFRVTKDTPEPGGCSDEAMELQIFPNVAMFFGGKLLEISGPCPVANNEIFCRFGSGSNALKTRGFKANDMTLKCPVPRLTQRGALPVSVSVDGDKTYIGQGSIYIVMYGPIPRSVDLVYGWYEVTPNNITMTWDPADLSMDGDVKVDIKLIGFRETATQIIWKDLSVLATNANNTGRFVFKPSDHQCSQEDCDLFEIGMVEVTPQDAFYTKTNKRVAMNAGVVPLGWYMNNAMVKKHGAQWPSKRCTEWYNKDKVDMSWMEQLLYCPCNVDQALADFGRWQPDAGCNMFSSSVTNCYYHKGAKHCVRSFQPSSTGSGNQCCYGEDGLLSYAADSYQGSTPDKGHDWGAYPYNKPGYVPSYSHWIEDVVTFYYCCLWNEYSHCDYYMEQRATRDCNGYQPSKAATAFGDPHIMTFDGKLYNFGGKGDYILLSTNSFTLQGKFKVGNQMHADDRRYNATVLTSVSMKAGTSSKVEIRLVTGLTSGRRLDVFVDDKLKLFNSKAMAKQDFNGVSVINLGITVDPNNLRHDNFTILLQSGVGVQVAASNGLLHVVVNVPPGFQSQTSGLMGTWNNNVNDDFTTKTGTVIDATSTPEVVFNNFAKTWNVEQGESLFTYHNMADDDFIPVYVAPQIPPGSLTDIDDVCKDNAQCRFDYIVTGNRDIGNASKSASEWFAELQSFQRLAATCGLLDVPYATKNNYNYTLGNTVAITGCRNGGKVSGVTTYTCTRKDGELQWQPTVSAKCSAPTTTKPGVNGATSARKSDFSIAIFIVATLFIVS